MLSRQLAAGWWLCAETSGAGGHLQWAAAILLQQPSSPRDPQPHWRGQSLVPSSPRWWCQGAVSHWGCAQSSLLTDWSPFGVCGVCAGAALAPGAGLWWGWRVAAVHESDGQAVVLLRFATYHCHFTCNT